MFARHDPPTTEHHSAEEILAICGPNSTPVPAHPPTPSPAPVLLVGKARKSTHVKKPLRNVQFPPGFGKPGDQLASSSNEFSSDEGVNDNVLETELRDDTEFLQVYLPALDRQVIVYWYLSVLTFIKFRIPPMLLRSLVRLLRHSVLTLVLILLR